MHWYASRVSKHMTESKNTIRLWDYCAEPCPSIHNLTSKNNFKLQYLTPHAALTGEQSDISNLCQFGWFKLVYHSDDKKNFPEHKEVLGKALGPSKGIGKERDVSVDAKTFWGSNFKT